MATLLDLDGFAHQTDQLAQAGSGFIGTYSAHNGTPTFDTTVKRLTEHWASLKIVQDGATAQRVNRSVPAGNRLLVASFYIRVTAAPSVSSTIFTFATAGTSGSIGMDSTGHLFATLAGTAQTTSGTYADGNWHLIDARCDSSGTTFTLDWQVDGAVQTQATRSGQTATDFGNWAFGSGTASHTLTFWMQDAVLSATTGDYPIGDHVVWPLYPNGEGGNETLGSSNKIQDEAAGQSNLYQKVDDWNGSGNVPSTSDYVTYASTTTGDAASNFAEFTLTDPPSQITSIWDVVMYLAGFASATGADTATARLVDSSNATIDDTGAVDYSGSATVLGYHRKTMARPGAGWTSTLAGTKARWGFSTDTNGIPRLAALLLEYAAPLTRSTKTHSTDAIIQLTSTKTQSADAIVKTTSTKTQSADAIIQKTLSASQSADAIVKKTLTVAQSADAIVKKTLTAAQSADAVIEKTATAEQSADSVILKTAAVDQSADAIVRATLAVSQDSDAIIDVGIVTSTIEQDADAIVKATLTAQQSADAVVKKTLTVAQSADAIVKKTASVQQQTDAVILKAATAQQSADAVVKKTSTAAQSADAVVKKVLSVSQSADAIVKKTLTCAQSADAVIRKTSTVEQSADAMIAARVQITHDTDAVVLATLAADQDVDAIVRKTAAVTQSADAEIVKPSVDHRTDSFIFGTAMDWDLAVSGEWDLTAGGEWLLEDDGEEWELP